MKQGTFTLEEIMTVLPDDFQIGQSKCNSEELIPLLLTIINLSTKLPEELGFTVKLSADSNQPGVEVEAADNSLTELTGIWYYLSGHKDCPLEPDNNFAAFFNWLCSFRLTDLDKLQWHTIGWGPDSLQGWYKKYRDCPDENPIKFLSRIAPNWDGQSVIRKDQITIRTAGFQNLITACIIPGLIIILKELKVV